MLSQKQSGFTVVELIISICIIGISMTSITFLAKAKGNYREKEVKKNLHTIQTYLAKYATDHNGQYPSMIWGGDRKGWSTEKNVGCRTMWEHKPFDGKNEDEAIPPFDPLILYGYTDRYPTNPFLTSADALKKTIYWTNPKGGEYGDGDPRFGFKGNIMGNIIEDPKYLWTAPGQITRIKNSFIDKAKDNHVGMVIPELPGNPFYAFGGLPEWPQSDSLKELNDALKAIDKNDPSNCNKICAYWPGEFLYRSAGSMLFPEEFLLMGKPNPKMKYIWDFKYSRLDRYFLCAFGRMKEDYGYDVIRLTDINGRTLNNTKGFLDDVFYQAHPHFVRTKSTPIHFSSPEVMGRGEYGKMPYFPYLDPSTGNFLYGAPDGFKDGIIIILATNFDENSY